MTRWQKKNEAKLQFITGNVYRRLPLFRSPEFCSLLLGSLEYCRRKYCVQVHGFVIMPNHFHLLVAVPSPDILSPFLRDCKGYTARLIVDSLRKQGKQRCLKAIRGKNPKRHKDSVFHVFQADTHVEGVYSVRFARQKLNYMHKNPLQAGLVQRMVDYRYSSARNWLLGDQSVFKIDPVELWSPQRRKPLG